MALVFNILCIHVCITFGFFLGMGVHMYKILKLGSSKQAKIHSFFANSENTNVMKRRAI